jgi:putative glycosyltransferase (TIGR04372 family)
MLKNFKNIFYLIIYIVLFLPILVYFILSIFKNFNKLKSSKNIIIQNQGGFAHSVMLYDLLRLNNKKNFLLIHFIEYGRCNPYLNKIFNINVIEIFTAYRNIKIFSKLYSIGDYEGGYNYAKLFIIYLLKKVFLRYCKIYTIEEYYKKIIKEHYPNKFQSSTSINDKITACWYCISDNAKSFNLTDDFVHKVESQFFLNKIKNKKICVIYIRKTISSLLETYIRNISIIKYKKTINFLIKSGYCVFITGDFETFELELLSKNENLCCYKHFTNNKKLFELYITLKCNLFIGNNGGGKTIAHYKKKILVNYFPFFFKPTLSKILYKNLFLNKKKINNRKIIKNFAYRFKISKPYYVKENTENEICNFVKSNIKKSYNN